MSVLKTRPSWNDDTVERFDAINISSLHDIIIFHHYELNPPLTVYVCDPLSHLLPNLIPRVNLTVKHICTLSPNDLEMEMKIISLLIFIVTLLNFTQGFRGILHYQLLKLRRPILLFPFVFTPNERYYRMGKIGNTARKIPRKFLFKKGIYVWTRGIIISSEKRLYYYWKWQHSHVLSDHLNIVACWEVKIEPS